MKSKLTNNGISGSVLREIERKAKAGIPLDKPTTEKNRIYEQYKTNQNTGLSSKIVQEIKRKAQSGIPLDKPTSEKNELYNLYSQKNQTDTYVNQLQDQVNAIYEKQREAQLQQLKASRDKAIGQLNQQKTQVAPQYQQMRNQTDAVNLQNVQRLRELMASAGLTSTGENVSANVAMNNQRVSSLNQLNLQEQQTIDDLNRRIADIQNPAEENALIAALEAERARALYDAYNRGQDIGYSRYRDNVMDERYNNEFDYQKQRDNVMDNRYNNEFDYQKQRDSLMDKRYNNQFAYEKQRDALMDKRYNNEFAYRKEQEKLERQWREYTYNNMSAADKARLDWAKAQFGEEQAWRMFELEYNGELQKYMNDTQIDLYSSGFQE